MQATGTRFKTRNIFTQRCFFFFLIFWLSWVHNCIGLFIIFIQAFLRFLVFVSDSSAKLNSVMVVSLVRAMILKNNGDQSERPKQVQLLDRIDVFYLLGIF